MAIYELVKIYDFYVPGSQMSYKHRNGGGHRKKSVSKGLLKKQGSSVEEAKTDEDKKIETIELKESATEKENPKVTHEETSFVFPKIDKKPGMYYFTFILKHVINSHLQLLYSIFYLLFSIMLLILVIYSICSSIFTTKKIYSSFSLYFFLIFKN